jgi:hypothetical protein
MDGHLSSQLEALITVARDTKKDSSFGGEMLWDADAAYSKIVLSPYIFSATSNKVRRYLANQKYHVALKFVFKKSNLSLCCQLGEQRVGKQKQIVLHSVHHASWLIRSTGGSKSFFASQRLLSPGTKFTLRV